MTQRSNSLRVLAGTLIDAGGIRYNSMMCRDESGRIVVEPFDRETSSTSFIEIVAIVSESSKDIRACLESLYEKKSTPEAIRDYLDAAGVLSMSGLLLSVGRQSSIIEM